MKLKRILLFSLFVSATKTFAAACCGGGAAVPSLIAGDNRAQMTTSYSMTEVVVDNVDSNGIWRTWDEHQTVQTFRVEGAHIFQDRWQVGFGVPIIQRSRQNNTYSGLGDVNLTLGYEYLPDWDYNPLRPKGIGFLQLTLPTGKSKADSEVGGLDSRGNGFWALGAGTLLTKNWRRLDAYTSLEIHHSFEKEIQQSYFQGILKPGLGGNLGLGLGYNFKGYRLGSSVNWTYEDPIDSKSRTGLVENGAVERYATAVVSLSYLASTNWTGTFSYSDQTLFGEPVNTSLGKGFSFQFQKRWNR